MLFSLIINVLVIRDIYLITNQYLNYNYIISLNMQNNALDISYPLITFIDIYSDKRDLISYINLVYKCNFKIYPSYFNKAYNENTYLTCNPNT